jgi:hypothetical protein
MFIYLLSFDWRTRMGRVGNVARRWQTVRKKMRSAYQKERGELQVGNRTRNVVRKMCDWSGVKASSEAPTAKLIERVAVCAARATY